MMGNWMGVEWEEKKGKKEKGGSERNKRGVVKEIKGGR